MNKSNISDNPSIIALETKEQEFIQTLALFKQLEEKLIQDAQQGNFSQREQTIQKLQGLLSSLEGILLEIQNMIKNPFNKGLENTRVSELTSTQLLHQSFNMDKSAQIYNDVKTQFESLIGERDNTRVNYNKNKTLFTFWFLLSLSIIIIFILYFKGYNIFDNYFIYLLLVLIAYLFFDIIKLFFSNIYNFIFSIYNSIVNFFRLFT